MVFALTFAAAATSALTPPSEPQIHCAISTPSWCIFDGDNDVSMRTDQGFRKWSVRVDEVPFEINESLNCDSVSDQAEIEVSRHEGTTGANARIEYLISIKSYSCTVRVIWTGAAKDLDRAKRIAGGVIGVGLNHKVPLYDSVPY